MVPALIAAGVGLAQLGGNLYSSYADRQQKEKAAKALQNSMAASNLEYDRMMGDIKDYYAKRGSLGSYEDAMGYKQSVSGYDPNSFVYTPDKTFDETFAKTRDDFINPYYSQIISDMTDQVQHSAAGAGLGRGSGAAAAIAKAVAEKDNELYKEAQQMYQDERNFQYTKYNDAIRNAQERLNQLRAATDTKITMQGNLANDYYSAMDAQQADLLKARQDKLGTAATYSSAMAGIY
jgi:hypothetical protein